jgi:aflatoxin B1 aldehyde reductase
MVAAAAGRPALSVILGTMTFAGQTGLDDAGAMLRTFAAAGHVEVDTARMYEHGKSEEMLGALLASEPRMRDSLAIASKANPFATHERTLSAESVRAQVGTSLDALGVRAGAGRERNGLSLLYLHAPDPLTPISETLAAAGELYKQGAFKELGLSNYQAWEVRPCPPLRLCEGHSVPPAPALRAAPPTGTPWRAAPTPRATDLCPSP